MRQSDSARSVLLTGSTGMLGGCTRAALLERGVCADTPGRDTLDLQSSDSTTGWMLEHRPEVVIHLAGFVQGLLGNLHGQGESFIRNARMAVNLFEACVVAPPRRLIVAGTAAAYGHPYSSLPLQEIDFLSGDVHQGEYGYGWAKRFLYASLEILRRDHSVETSYTVLTNLFGPGDQFRGTTTHVIPALVSRFTDAADFGHGVVTVWGSPTTTRDFMYADDAAAVLAKLALAKDVPPPLVNVASGDERSLESVVACITEASGFTGLVEWDSTMPVGIPHRSMDVGTLRAIYGSPQKDFSEAIATTVAWYRENREACR